MGKLDGLKTVIQSLYQDKGSVSPSRLVEAARPKDSPAHNAFEWNDKKASNEYRLIQARNYLRIVKIEVNPGTHDRMVHIPRFESDPGDGQEGTYKPMSIVVQNADEYSVALRQLRNAVDSAVYAFDELTEARKSIGKVKPAEERQYKVIQAGLAKIKSAFA